MEGIVIDGPSRATWSGLRALLRFRRRSSVPRGLMGAEAPFAPVELVDVACECCTGRVAGEAPECRRRRPVLGHGLRPHQVVLGHVVPRVIEATVIPSV